MAYGAVDRKTWNDELFRTWSNDTKLIWLYLLTCPHGNRIGCFVLDPGYAAADLQMTKHEIESALEFFEQEDRIAWDPAARVVCIRKHLHPDYNPLANQSVAKAAAKDVRELPMSMKCFQALLDAVEKWSRPHYEPFTEALMHRVEHGDPHGGGHQEQEQDHEQEQEHGTLGSSLRSSPNEAGPRSEDPSGEGKPNRWSGTVDALREHFWQADQPPGKRTVGQELSVAKQVCRTYNLDPPEFVEAVEGFARLRKAGRWEGWVEKGEACHALVLNRTPEDANGIPVVIRSLHEARKNHTPPEKRGRSGPVPLSEAMAGG